MARGQSEVTEQLLLCNEATQVSRMAPQKDETLRMRYQETIDTNVNAGCVRKDDQAELNETKHKLQWYLPHHPVINPHKPEKVRRVCNAAVKYQGVALNDKLLSGPDLLQSLIGIIFRFREHPIALSADMESMFLQVAVPIDENRCLQFALAKNSHQRILRAENRSLRVHKTRFWGKKLAVLCKLRFAPSGER